ncbi:MAG: polysaccharide deacetylase family protein [Candidatus Omnitrophica bacterium]|nr:polysaccharide deacetylase family protein [Candidatus Omnitrophota bacterium]
MKKEIFVIFLCILIFIIWAFPKYSIPVLLYHSISDNDNLLSVKPDNFKKQVAYLKKANYRIIKLDEFLEIMESRKKIPRKTVVITFDDGYKDNFTYAYPILKECNFPAIIFLITGKVGKEIDFLNWDEIKEMVGSKIIDFGGHTRNHIYLPSIQNEEKLWKKFMAVKKILRKIPKLLLNILVIL